MGDTRDIVRRRFGRNFEQPCGNPNMIECALLECQIAGRCQLLPNMDDILTEQSKVRVLRPAIRQASGGSGT